MASRKMRDYTAKRIYWDIFLHLGMHYKGNIRFSKEFEANIQEHIALLEGNNAENK